MPAEGQDHTVPALSHGHLWTLTDGTGLHAPVGHLVQDGDMSVCCHLCGRWFIALGAHVRVHGYTADGYRETMGLGATTALVAATLSQRTSKKRAAAYRTYDEVRQRFAPGHAMARDGRLTAHARSALDRGPEPPERVRVRAGALATGRETRARQRAEALDQRVQTAGAESLSDYLRREYDWAWPTRGPAWLTPPCGSCGCSKPATARSPPIDGPPGCRPGMQHPRRRSARSHTPTSCCGPNSPRRTRAARGRPTSPVHARTWATYLDEQQRPRSRISTATADGPIHNG
jgi:hypothetical protein